MNKSSLLMACYGEHNKSLIGDHLDQHLIEVVPCFWVKFPLPTFLLLLGFVIIYTLNLAIAVTGNGFIVFLWYRYRALRTASNILLINLCVAGLVLLSPLPLFYINLAGGGPATDLTGAKVFGLVSTVGAMAQIWLLTCLTVERAWVVWCISHVKQHRLKKSSMKMVVISVWLTATLVGALPLFGWNRYVYEGYLLSSSIDFLAMDSRSLSFTWFLMLVGWILPNFLILSSHVIVITSYRGSIKEFAQQMGDMTRTNFLKQRLMSERKLWRASLMMLLSWTVAWTPYALMFLASVSGYRDLISHHSTMWAAVLCKVSVSVNPFIYGLMLPGFKKQFRKFFGLGGKKVQSTRTRDLSRWNDLETYNQTTLLARAEVIMRLSITVQDGGQRESKV